MRVDSFQLIKFCCTLTDPAAETKSIGLQADPAFGEGRRAGALFFARHLDYSIVTHNSHPSPGLGTVKTVSSRLETHRLPTGPDSYRDWQKTRHHDADANSLYRRAVSVNSFKSCTLDNYLDLKP
jgi:hypothetical protein